MTRGNVPASTRFLPEYLKPLGYRTYHSGKWHIRFVTGERGVGFDHSYTLMDEDRYFTPRRLLLDGEPLPQPKPEEHYYTTTAIADYAVRFLREHARDHAREPFLLYMAPHSPHFPLQAPAEDIEKYKDRFAEGWDALRERKLARMQRMGLVNCSLAPLEPDMWTHWNTPDAELLARIGPGEVTRAVPWSTLTAEQKSLPADQDGDPRGDDFADGLRDRPRGGPVARHGRRSRYRGPLPLRQRRKFRAVDPRRRARPFGAIGRARAVSSGSGRAGPPVPTRPSGCTNRG